jgi:chlorite dismutase
MDPDSIRYAGYFVYRRRGGPVEDAEAGEIVSLTDSLADADVVTRGWYDVSGMRADADVMVWWHAPTADALQQAARQFRATRVAGGLEPTWSAIGLHRASEFNKAHLPAFIDGKDPRAWVAVYPYIRSYDWYLLPPTERAALLGEHGKLGRDYPDVLSNTIAAFALGDYEWLLAIECDQLDKIVDLMRHLRASATRRHVRLETPFFTGRRIEPADVVGVLS